MGTRATTNIYEQWEGKEPALLVSIYRQCDGYYEGHGKEIATFLASRPVVNGMRDENPCFNGPGCLATQLIAELSDGPGNIYVCKPITTKEQQQGHHYDVIVHFGMGGGHVEFVATCSYGEHSYRGSPAEFGAWVDKLDEGNSED